MSSPTEQAAPATQSVVYIVEEYDDDHTWIVGVGATLAAAQRIGERTLGPKDRRGVERTWAITWREDVDHDQRRVWYADQPGNFMDPRSAHLFIAITAYQQES
jgi:ABC-type phosphonate transport system ATPase subunit